MMRRCLVVRHHLESGRPSGKVVCVCVCVFVHVVATETERMRPVAEACGWLGPTWHHGARTPIYPHMQCTESGVQVLLAPAVDDGAVGIDDITAVTRAIMEILEPHDEEVPQHKHKHQHQHKETLAWLRSWF